ncbi:uncharacterized protein MICPUCDRAFT_50355 [Micromonas pusilla CCMP1545]|jgi:hypothetical protein|uniref:Predicted protein n=2 Tax=Micromonas pusilla TaxID=38833 RepID=C1MHX4_MICPC|nr:uncharacterized protein MICPUCDRAFT_50355 [Micromonas pusilla CCMP1545]EEH60283.1 predicted protein [Micromonas pusilla CCMP1545]|eukprot:XP_003055031.1 predicted protein [Micromonas pusilla CCMP1545]
MALRCRVWNRYDELPERALPVRAGITGSPLIVQPTKIVPAGYAATAPRPPKLKVFALDWGEKETGAPAVSKRFYCVNKGPHDMTVNFEAWLSPPDPDLNGVTCALTKLIVDEDAEFVSVDILGQGEKCGEKGPFTVVPSGDVVVPKLGGQRQFEVTYSYRGKPRKFVGAVVGTHSVRGPGANANRGLKLELGCAATKNRVGDVDADAPERDAAARRAVAKPVRVRINDAFHFTSAGPPMQMKPLLVRMQATAFSPRLTVDERENFRWRCYSPVDVSDGSYYKSVTLTNAWAKPLGFKMSIGGPFEITDVVSSVPQLAFDRETSFVACARARAAAKVSKPPPKISDVDFVLPAEENVHVTMRFVPPEPDEDDFGNPIHDDATLDGGLVLDYDNGTRDVQTFKLLCEYLHPALEVNVQEIDFGKVHCAAKTLSARRLTLTNTGEADAEWAMHFPRWMHRVGMAGSVFECVPASGIIPGTGPHGKPRSVEIEILLDAKKPERYASALTFKPRLGRGCSVVVQGEGTLDEEYEGQIMPRFEPIDDA